MTIILIQAANATQAAEVVEQIEAGSLWGVDLGTTSSGASHESWILVRCTLTRASNLTSAAPEGFDVDLQDNDPASFSDSTLDQKAWYLLGKL